MSAGSASLLLAAFHSRLAKSGVLRVYTTRCDVGTPSICAMDTEEHTSSQDWPIPPTTTFMALGAGGNWKQKCKGYR